MSALAPKADIARPPLACPVSAISGHRPASFDQLVGAQDQTGWYLEAEGLRSPEIDYHLQLRRLLNRQVGRHERDQASTVAGRSRCGGGGVLGAILRPSVRYAT